MEHDKVIDMRREGHKNTNNWSLDFDNLNDKPKSYHHLLFKLYVFSIYFISQKVKAGSFYG